MAGAVTTAELAAPAAASPRPTLSIIDAMAITVGIVIGAGIFEIPTLVAANASSTGVVLLVWILGGLVSLIGALCYAELTTTYPHPGGNYYYLHRAFGPSVAFLFAWARLAVIQTGSIALISFVFGDYASRWFSLGDYSASIYAAAAIIIFTAVNVAGIRMGRSTQRMLTLLELTGLSIIIIAGFLMPANGQPAAAQAAPAVSNFGLMMVFVLLAFGGWNEAAFISAEVRGSRRNTAWALVASIGVITLMYVLVNAAFMRGLGLSGTAGSKAVAADLLSRAGESSALVVSLIVAATALSSLNGTIITGARTNYALGRDFGLFRRMGEWVSVRETPASALVLQGGVALLLVLLGTSSRNGFSTMVEYTAPVFWLFFLLTGISLFVLRRKDRDLARPFPVPLYPITPILFCATCAYLLYSSLAYTGLGALVGAGVLVLGLPLLVVARRTRERNGLGDRPQIPERKAA